jgi:hypothetical protein
VAAAAAAARTPVAEVGEIVRAPGVKVIRAGRVLPRAGRGGHDHLAPRAVRRGRM